MAGRVRFTEDVRRGIITGIKMGVSYERAAAAEGVSVRQLHRRLRQGEADLEEGKPHTVDARFSREFKRAEAAALGQIEASMWEQAHLDWRAGAWILAKKLPLQYGQSDDAVRAQLQKQVVTEFLDFVQSHISKGAFHEVCEALAGYGNEELDAKVLPCPG